MLVRRIVSTTYRYIVEGPDTEISSPQACQFFDEAHILDPPEGIHPPTVISQYTPAADTGTIYAQQLDSSDTRPSDYVVDENGTLVT
jgi:hypothetical protein